MYRIGIDLGGTKIEGVLLDTGDEKGGRVEYRELNRFRVPTDQERGYEAILGTVNEVQKKLALEIAGKPYTLGVGTPGSISPKTNLLRGSNTVALNGKPVEKDLAAICGRPLDVENDANCFAMAEAIYGAGQGYRMVFGVIMGTGCGAGLIIDGKVWRGAMASGGEWGHHTIDPNGPDCFCGKKGCAELYISGGGLEKRYYSLFNEKRKLADILTDYRSGKAREKEFIEFFFDQFGRALSNIINILDPNAVVMGGGLSNVPEVYTFGVERLKRYVLSDYFDTPILKNKLGDSAGVIGAALIGK